MILVKKKHLYVLVTLVCILLVFGEIRFFMALKSVNLATNLAVKYEVESFVFASIILTISVYLFLVFFMRKSDNVLKRLDKMIELSEYGKHDVSGHLKKLNKLGKKIEYLLYNFKELNAKQALKISSLSAIISILVKNNESPIFLLNRHGNITECSDRLLALLGVESRDMVKRNFNDLFEDEEYSQLFYELEEAGGVVEKGKKSIRIQGKELTQETSFFPVKNSRGDISHIIGVFGVHR